MGYVNQMKCDIVVRVKYDHTHYYYRVINNVTHTHTDIRYTGRNKINTCANTQFMHTHMHTESIVHTHTHRLLAQYHSQLVQYYLRLIMTSSLT